MTLEEKLAKFSETLAKETENKSAKAVEDYHNTLENNLKKHKEDALNHAELQIQHAYATYKKEKIKYIATTKFNIKKTLGKKSIELKDSLYRETIDKLLEFKNSSQYIDLLKSAINKVKDYSKDNEFIIYIDKSDSNIIDKIKSLSNSEVRISEDSIIGGINAFVPKNKVLLNLSFKDKLTNLIDDFDWSKEGWNGK